MTNKSTDTPRTDAQCIERITDYLFSGGLWNPELAIHDNVRDLLIDCREELAASKAEVERLKNDFKRLKTLMHQTIWFVDDMIKTHTNGCEHCHKKHGAMIALFKDITEETQWPIDPTDK